MENNTDISAMCAEIIKRNGLSRQKRKLAEEGFELVEAITEMQVAPSAKNLTHIVEEMADVFVVWRQIAEYYGIQWSEIARVADYKCKRTLMRLDNGAE